MFIDFCILADVAELDTGVINRKKERARAICLRNKYTTG